MKELAPGVRQLQGRPSDLINTYLIEDVLIDAGTRYDGGRILRELSGHKLSAHALTHAHPDHLGCSHLICEQLAVPFWVGAEDAAAAADSAVLAASLIPQRLKRTSLPTRTLAGLFVSAQAGPGHPVAHQLREGDAIAGFQVLHVPGHTPGHLAFWRESDRVLICGDVFWNFHFVAGAPGLTEPLATSCSDPAQNRDSARRLAALEPQLVCFGHGPPLRDPRRLKEFADRLAR